MLSLDFVRLYDVSKVPIKIVNGRNNGMYSNNRTHESYSASNAVAFDGKRSTNVTANIMPHTINNTNPTPEKNRRIKNRVKIFVLNIMLKLYLFNLIIAKLK